MWLQTPGGLSQSNIGIKGKEAITSGLDFVFDLNFGFDPYSMTAANGPKSFLDNNGLRTPDAKLERQLEPRGPVL